MKNPYLKVRLFGLWGLLVSGSLFAYNWSQLLRQEPFSLRLCAATPMVILMSLLIIASPQSLGRFVSKGKKLTAAILLTLTLGGALGGVNFYSMNRYAQRTEVKQKLDAVPPMPESFAPRPATQRNQHHT